MEQIHPQVFRLPAPTLACVRAHLRLETTEP